jgi:hypothetical protein
MSGLLPEARKAASQFRMLLLGHVAAPEEIMHQRIAAYHLPQLRAWSCRAPKTSSDHLAGRRARPSSTVSRLPWQPHQQPADRASNTASLDIEPRLQWNANYGDLRRDQSHQRRHALRPVRLPMDGSATWPRPGVDQDRAGKSQLLLGVNDLAAASPDPTVGQRL